MHGDPPHQSFELVGRDELLDECGSKLESSNLLVLTGVPGVGKTRIALALSLAKKGEYEFVWWLRASDEAQLEASIGRLAAAAGVPPCSSSEQTLRNLVNTMRQPGLIVFDDAESLAALERHIAASGAADVLVTTSSDSPQAYLVRGLSANSEVVEFIRSLCGISAEDAGRLIEEVDGRPLLLLHACQFIGANNSTVADYLEMLESPGSIFDSWPLQASDYERPQERIIPLSLSRLVEGSTSSRELCELLAALAPTPIPINVVEAFDEDAGDFLLAAQESFVVIRNPESQTVEVPTLIRAAIREMAGEPTSHLRGRAWRALAAVTENVTEPAHRDYLAEHIIHLGADPDGVVATASLAIDLDERPLAVTLWRQAYDGSVLAEPNRHSTRRASLADRLGLALLNEGIYREAEAIVSGELALANEAGCIPCRAPLLILLGHLAKARRKPENEEIRMFQAAAAAYRIVGEKEAALAQTLASIIDTCEQKVDEGLKRDKGLDLAEIVEIGWESLRELEGLRQGLMPAGSAGIGPINLKSWDRVESSWAEAMKRLRTQLADDEESGENQGDGATSEAPEHVRWSPAFAFAELVNTLLHRDADLDALVEISRHMVGLRRTAEDPETAREAAEVLAADSRSLRAGLVDQYGADSHAIALADYVEMIGAHLEQDEEKAAGACRRFLIGTLEATNVSQTVALLHKGLSFSLDPRPDEKPTDADRTMTRAASWLTRLPDVEAFLWLAFQQWSSSEDLPQRVSVYRALHEIRKLGHHGPSTAAHLSHMYGHRKHLPPTESLRYHRISVRMYELIGVPVSDWGHGLYCYAHRLLETDRPDAATRRFREARELLTFVDKGSAAVLHIDEHLNSPTAPYLEGE